VKALECRTRRKQGRWTVSARSSKNRIVHSIPRWPQRSTRRSSRRSAGVRKIYARNYFPENAAVSWRRFRTISAICTIRAGFRCHDGKHLSEEGKVFLVPGRIIPVIRFLRRSVNDKLRPVA